MLEAKAFDMVFCFCFSATEINKVVEIYCWTDSSGSLIKCWSKFSFEQNQGFFCLFLIGLLTWQFCPSWATNFSATNYVWCRCPIYPWTLMDKNKECQCNEYWWGGLLFKSHSWLSSGITRQPSHRKSSDEGDGSLWRSLSPMTDETVRTVVRTNLSSA